MHPPLCRKSVAFSLVELLIVVAMIGILAVVSVPAALSGIRGMRLTTAGNQLADLSALARQTALSKNVITAVVFAPTPTDGSGPSAGVIEFGPDRQWRLATQWLQLPDSVEITNSAEQDIPAPTGAPTLTYRGKTFSPTGGLVFYPTGKMPPVGTSTDAPKLTVFQKGQSTATANKYEIAFSLDTSSHRITRN